MSTLDEKIEQLKAEDAFENEMQSLIGNYKHLAYIGNSEKTVSIDLLKPDDVNPIETQLHDLFNILAPDYSKEESTEYGNRKVITGKPFYMSFCNPAKYKPPYVLLSYHTKAGVYVRINVPATHYANLHHTSRKVTDSEYHYFTGMRVSDMPMIPVVYPALFPTLRYYGGDYTVDQTDMSDESLTRFHDYIITGK